MLLRRQGPMRRGVQQCEMLKLADFAKVADAPTRVAESAYVDATAMDPAACLLRGYVAPQVGSR